MPTRKCLHDLIPKNRWVTNNLKCSKLSIESLNTRLADITVDDAHNVVYKANKRDQFTMLFHLGLIKVDMNPV